MSASLKKKVESAEAKLHSEIEAMWARLKDSSVPQDEKKKIHAAIERLEESLRHETGQIRKKCGLNNKK